MATSFGQIKSLAKGVAKPAMKYMLEDLAKNIRDRSRRLSAHDGGLALEIVADEIEKINVSKYF